MNQPTALIIDDEQDIRELIEMSFMGIGIDCILSPTVTDAIKQLKHNDDLSFCITDMRLPDGDGLDLVAYIQKHRPNLPVCVITAHGNVELAVKALKLGAFDFVNKPFDLKQLRTMAKSALKLNDNSLTEAETETETIASGKEHKPRSHKKTPVNLIGDSTVMQKLAEIIKKLARSQAPVFIHGESGTGKELVARSIHNQSARQEGPFIPVNCGAIPENLVESEFFGYKKGAFTGANKEHPGLFAAAHGGTLFLDEVADLPLPMQVKLLRAIQERAIRPIGGDKEIPIDVRILSATHKDLSSLVESQDFREDLYYRLNVISLGMPPLRKRQGDVPVLTQFIIKKIANTQGNSDLHIEDSALEKLNQYSFPGNVRELENILERAITFCENNKITVDDIHFDSKVNQLEAQTLEGMSFDLSNGLTENEAAPKQDNSDNSTSPPTQTTAPSSSALPSEAMGDLENYIEQIEKEAIQAAMEICNNNITKAADKLGISFRALRYKLKKYDMR